MKPSSVLTLDCATKCTGWAFAERKRNSTYHIRAFGAIWQPPRDYHVHRTYNIVRAISKIVRLRKPEKIVIERYFSRGKKKNQLAVPYLIGALLYELHTKYPNIEFMEPSKWRRILGIKKGKDWKLSTIRYIKNHYRSLRKVYNNLKRKYQDPPDDTYDAVAIMLAYLTEKGCKVK